MLAKIGKILSILYLVAAPAVGIAGDCTMQWDFTPDGIATTFELQRAPVEINAASEPTTAPSAWVAVSTEIPIKKRTFVDKAVPEGGWVWRIRARDSVGKCSSWSDYVFGLSKRNKPDGLGVDSKN